MADVTIKTGDVLIVRRTLLDGDGDPVNLSGADVRFQMSGLRGPRFPVLAGSATIVQAGEDDVGVVEFETTGTDDLEGGYRADFVVTYAGGEEQTFPGGRDLLIAVLPRAAVDGS